MAHIIGFFARADFFAASVACLTERAGTAVHDQPRIKSNDPRRITMKTNQYRSHSIAAALAATFVTTVLVSSLVESFEPAQLLRIEDQAARETVIALERRPAAAPADWT
jgi:hypothetical protein